MKGKSLTSEQKVVVLALGFSKETVNDISLVTKLTTLKVTTSLEKLIEKGLAYNSFTSYYLTALGEAEFEKLLQSGFKKRSRKKGKGKERSSLSSYFPKQKTSTTRDTGSRPERTTRSIPVTNTEPVIKQIKSPTLVTTPVPQTTSLPARRTELQIPRERDTRYIDVVVKRSLPERKFFQVDRPSNNQKLLTE
jgi:hypothetical protein